MRGRLELDRPEKIGAPAPVAQTGLVEFRLSHYTLPSVTNTKRSSGSRGHDFIATRWSIIMTARDLDAGSAYRRAMAELARTYWAPLYAYLRRNGHPPERAEDLTQSFFARLIERNDLRSVDAAKGKFRSFVLVALKHFVANELDKERAQKRGGGVRTISLSDAEAESGYRIEPIDTLTPEQAFNRRWAMTVLSRVVNRLRAEYRRRDQLPLFDAIQGTLTGEVTAGYATLAGQLGTTEGALQVAAHRMRKRYRELLRLEVAQTVSDPALVDEELRELLDSV
jgi:DNA-directed RNA polymerase specialized sigma24 family protein